MQEHLLEVVEVVILVVVILAATTEELEAEAEAKTPQHLFRVEVKLEELELQILEVVEVVEGCYVEHLELLLEVPVAQV